MLHALFSNISVDKKQPIDLVVRAISVAVMIVSMWQLQEGNKNVCAITHANAVTITRDAQFFPQPTMLCGCK